MQRQFDYMSDFKQSRNTANLFSASVLRTLASGHFSLGTDVRELGSFFESAYSELLDNYRSEYVYKNAIAEKLVRGRHRFSKNCYFSTEFRVGNSLADVLVANGTTTVYEIKTEYDSFDRLKSQLSDYENVFDKIHVVIPAKKVEDWAHKIPSKFGITMLTERYSLQELRNAESNISNINLSVLFNLP